MLAFALSGSCKSTETESEDMQIEVLCNWTGVDGHEMSGLKMISSPHCAVSESNVCITNGSLDGMRIDIIH